MNFTGRFYGGSPPHNSPRRCFVVRYSIKSDKIKVIIADIDELFQAILDFQLPATLFFFLQFLQKSCK